MNGDTGMQLHAVRPWLQQRVPPAQLQQVVHLVGRDGLEDAPALLRALPALASWAEAA
nr:hypothetical protein [Variovorax boronicumulans]